MNNPSPTASIDPRRFLTGALALCVLCVMSFQALAQERIKIQASFKKDTEQTIKIDLLVGQSRIIEFDEEFQSVSMSDPAIADPVLPSNSQIVINGLKFGQVNLIVWKKSSPSAPLLTIIFDIYVQNNLNLIDNQIKILFPKENIQLSQANDSVVISGSVTRQEISDQVEKIIKASGFKEVVNLIKPPLQELAQVELRIRIAEVNRSVLRRIGPAFGVQVPSREGTTSAVGSIGATALTAGASQLVLTLGNLKSIAVTEALIQALQTRGAFRQLAEPNLIAANGHEASFMAGGEFPIPIVQGTSGGNSNAVTIQFRPFGVQLKFKPTIRDENHIGLEISPEVSDIDLANAVQLNGFSVPGLRVRKATTYIELADGQSFSLAGLLDNQEDVNISKIPGLGDIPILGELFKSRSFQRRETELLFLCTVKLVEPLNPDQLPRLPGVGDAKALSQTPAGNFPNSAPSGVIEGDSGHAPPKRKISELMTAPAPQPAGQPVPVRLEKAASTTKP